MTYNEIKDKYNNFIFENYLIEELQDKYKITYYFEIEDLKKFRPTLEINKEYITNKNINMHVFKDMVFHIGMIEAISYWKCAMPKNIIVKCGNLTKDEETFFKKIYYNGLGEFRYTNNIEISYKDFCQFKFTGQKNNVHDDEFKSSGNIVTIGGGKDSVVAINLVKNMDNKAFVLNPKSVQIKCAKKAGLEIVSMYRTLDSNMIELNKEGYLNGHTPFSALLSFLTYLMAYLTNRKYIVLSNESSANESNVRGTNINHQYSKSLEYENDFIKYTSNHFNLDIHYFSLLRPLYEIQIAQSFSKYKEYHNIFKSCNKGSKSNPWVWCCNCSKCLFVYTMLSAFLSDDELINIFGENLFEKKDLLETFRDLIGVTDNKPFDCVGTYEEVNFAIQKRIKNGGNLPYLLDYYNKNINIKVREDLLSHYDENNNLPKEFIALVKGRAK